MGLFSRVLDIEIQGCKENRLFDPNTDVEPIRLPRFNEEFSPSDRVPRVAVVSGDFDQVECVLQRMGIEKLDIYNGRDPGTKAPPSIGDAESLFTDYTTMNLYDIIVVNCSRLQYEKFIMQNGARRNIEHFVANGGRLFVTDWAYDIIEQVPEFAPHLCFEPKNPPREAICSNTSEPPSIAVNGPPYGGKSSVLDQNLANWLSQFPDVLDSSSKIDVEYNYVVIESVSKSNPLAVKIWLETKAPMNLRPISVSFDYRQCGRVHYSTFNVDPYGIIREDGRWPENCKSTFSPQERVLEYFVFDTAACVYKLD